MRVLPEAVAAPEVRCAARGGFSTMAKIMSEGLLSFISLG